MDKAERSQLLRQRFRAIGGIPLPLAVNGHPKPAQMHKINDTTFGLRRWYGMRAARKQPGTVAEQYLAALKGEGEPEGSATDSGPKTEPAT